MMMRTVAKALELFLALIVEEASKVTIERGSKKVEPYHLYVQRARLIDGSSLINAHTGSMLLRQPKCSTF